MWFPLDTAGFSSAVSHRCSQVRRWEETDYLLDLSQFGLSSGASLRTKLSLSFCFTLQFSFSVCEEHFNLTWPLAGNENDSSCAGVVSELRTWGHVSDEAVG